MRWIEGFWRDVKYGVRTLLRQPGFTALALLALVLGIGLNTSLFTAFNAFALRPWPVRDPARVVNLYSAAPGKASDAIGGFTTAEYRAFAEHSRTMSGVFLMIHNRVRLDDQPDGSRTMCHYVSGNYFQLLGVDMALGRGFVADEDRFGAPRPVAVLAYSTWTNRYASDPHILGRRITLDGTPFTVIGVAGAQFTGTSPERHDLWIPISAVTLVKPHDDWAKALVGDPRFCCASMAGRLAPGATKEQAQEELTALSHAALVSTQDGDHNVLATSTEFFARPGARRKMLPLLALVFGAVGAVLLLACANVSNLLLARGAARQREIAVRLSLGAERSRIVCQLLTESLLLASVAAAIGLIVANYLPGFIAARVSPEARAFRFEPDYTVAVFAAGLAVLSAALFGLAPALRGADANLIEAMKRHSGSVTRTARTRGALLGVQVAISATLLIAAGLLVRGLDQARSLDPGFAVDGRTIVSVDLPVNRYDDARGRAFFEDVSEKLRNMAGADEVGLSVLPPLGNVMMMTRFGVNGRADQRDTVLPLQVVNAAYFDVLRIPIVSGRNFSRGDAGHNAIIVNEALARKFWPGRSAVGQAVTAARGPGEVIGVVRDAQVSGLGPVEPTLFLPFNGDQHAALLLRTMEDTAEWRRRIEEIIGRAEPQAVVTAAPLSGQIEKWLMPARAGAALAAALGLLALLLATVGVYGVIAYSVEQRCSEIGVRMALGAKPSEIVWFVVKSNGRALATGLVCGLALSIVISRLLQSYLFGLKPVDPAAYGSVLAIMLVSGVAASAIPARRAARIAPLSVLRCD
jgi:predicted permease